MLDYYLKQFYYSDMIDCKLASLRGQSTNNYYTTTSSKYYARQGWGRDGGKGRGEIGGDGDGEVQAMAYDAPYDAVNFCVRQL